MVDQKYDQEFFLALAAKGKDAWNEWRRDPANKDVRVTFASVDFAQAPRDQINFEGFEFGDHADFSGCKWGGAGWKPRDIQALAQGISFTSATFGDDANFAGAAFICHARFDKVTFGHQANFLGAAFELTAKFAGAAFGFRANFTGAAFKHSADFTGASFGSHAHFDSVNFGFDTRFSGATFDNSAFFTGAAFGSGFDARADFVGTYFGLRANFRGATFSGSASFTGAAFWLWSVFDDSIFMGRVDFAGLSDEDWPTDLASHHHVFAVYPPLDEETLAALKRKHEEVRRTRSYLADRFFDISFAKARFYREAVFSKRSFEDNASFMGSRFYLPPNFDDVTNATRIDFSGAHVGFAPPGRLVHWTEDSRIPVRLRALRKIAEETKNHDLERDLYIEERKAERGVYRRHLLEELGKATKWQKPLIRWRFFTHWLWIGVMGLYWAFADYGRSFVVPAIWLAMSVPFFHWRYSAVLSALMHEAGRANTGKYDHAVWMLALGNTVPFVGPLTIDADIKKFLFCPGFGPCLPIPPEWFQFWVVFQNLLSIILVFFIGLALRNYFKIK
jgi:Pentapeptide repeats (9 copies)